MEPVWHGGYAFAPITLSRSDLRSIGTCTTVLRTASGSATLARAVDDFASDMVGSFPGEVWLQRPDALLQLLALCRADCGKVRSAALDAVTLAVRSVIDGALAVQCAAELVRPDGCGYPAAVVSAT